jgi:hypothetical protein
MIIQVKVPAREKSINEGECCRGCTMFFVRPHGHKVWCRHCWPRLSYKKKQSNWHHLATLPTLGELR